MATEALTDTEQFFYDHAGWSYNRGTETPEEGRARGARKLAAAERRLKDGPYYVNYKPDDQPWNGDEPYDGPLWIATLWSVAGSTSGEVLGAIGSVPAELGDPYMRVIAAELADEHLPE